MYLLHGTLLYYPHVGMVLYLLLLCAGYILTGSTNTSGCASINCHSELGSW